MSAATVQTIGARPVGTAKGDERWATVAHDDGMVVVTAYVGWGISDTVTLSGDTAARLVHVVVAGLLS